MGAAGAGLEEAEMEGEGCHWITQPQLYIQEGTISHTKIFESMISLRKALLLATSGMTKKKAVKR